MRIAPLGLSWKRTVVRNLLWPMLVRASRVARRTPLRRIAWLGRQHNRIFGRLVDSHTVGVAGYVLRVDRRDRTIAKKLALYGEYEAYIQELLISAAIPGSVVVDVGANIGLHTIPLAHHLGAAGQVFAFEPDPDNYKLLVQNIEANGLTNVVAYKVALGLKHGTALLYQNAENRGNLSLRETNIEDDLENLPPAVVLTEPGDHVLSAIPKPISLVKIDVEGAEPLVVGGMHQTLSRNPSVKLVFEFLPRFVSSFNIGPLDFLIGLEQEGFHLDVINSRERCVKPATAEEILALGESSSEALNIIAGRRN